MRVNRYETVLFVLWMPFYFIAFGLYHYMIFAVNRRLPAPEKIPHRLLLVWGGWNRVRDEYRKLYPRSSLYRLCVACAATVAAIAIVFVALRVWEYTHGRLP